MKPGRQLSLFNDKQVRRSFLSRFSCNPRRELINQLRMENLYSVQYVISETESHSISHISALYHLKHRHDPYTKIGKRYFYGH